jgi:hypothetical protein
MLGEVLAAGRAAGDPTDRRTRLGSFALRRRGATMRARAPVVTLALVCATAAACDAEFSETDVVDRYLTWQQDAYGGFADDRVQRVSALERRGPCLAAELVEQRGHFVTVFLRDEQVVHVADGHVGDQLDASAGRCRDRR